MRRALVAVALWFGFYAVGIGVALALFSLPWAQAHFEDGIGFSGFVCAAGGLSVLWALFPRFERFEPPSDPLDGTAFPRVEQLVRDVAVRVGHPNPQDLYLTPDANAFAGRRRRVWYRRPRTVVGVGLVFFEIFDREELASIVAHEMGHHSAGDVLLGPFIYRIRRAIGNALERLEGSSFWLHLPFVGYGELFLRVTRRTSREQELAADALASRISGRAATGRALSRLHELGPLWDAYWQEDVLPVLTCGFRPPLLDGFRHMLASPVIREDISTSARKMRDRAPSPTDTHPSLAERLAALGAVGGISEERPPARPDGARAWFDDVDAAELVVVRSILKDPSRELTFVKWDDVGETVWMPRWKKALADLEGALSFVTMTGLADLARDPSRLLEGLPRGLALLSPQAERRQVLRLLGTWLSVTLHDRGFRAHTAPGVEVRLERDGVSLEPNAILRALIDGRLGREEWRARCAELGLGEVKP
jgi:Zn-dependent protease with chaperone function